MDINIEKTNSLLQSSNFVEKLKSDLSDEGIKLQTKDAQDFKKIISGLYEMKDNNLSVSGGASVEDSFKDVGKGIGGIIGGTIRGVAAVVGGVAKGVGITAWGVLQVPLSLVYDVGKGLYEGGKEGLGIE